MAVSQGHRLRMRFVNFWPPKPLFSDSILHRMSCCTGCHVALDVMLHRMSCCTPGVCWKIAMEDGRLVSK